MWRVCGWLYVFFNDTATTEIYTLSLHDALPIFPRSLAGRRGHLPAALVPHERHERVHGPHLRRVRRQARRRSEEHTSELQSRQYLVCRLLLEKKTTHHTPPLPPRHQPTPPAPQP